MIDPLQITEEEAAEAEEGVPITVTITTIANIAENLTALLIRDTTMKGVVEVAGVGVEVEVAEDQEEAIMMIAEGQEAAITIAITRRTSFPTTLNIFHPKMILCPRGLYLQAIWN